jgi:Skp family chaperone for outer membrane proteins
MKKSICTSIIFFLVVMSGTLLSQQENGKVRIGIFDSRCIAMAYGRTDFMKEIDSIRTLHAKAKEAGNLELMKEMEQLGPTKQVLMHQQGFSTGSILNIMEKVKDKLPSIAKDNNVKFIVSKWEVMFMDESIELVDITDQLVEFFNPVEATRKIIGEIKAMEPVPIEKISINPMN